MPERDPRTNPQAGDKIIALNGRTRHVVRVVKNDIFYKINESGKEHKCWLGQWLEWCQQNVA
jgi:hypothetical protein